MSKVCLLGAPLDTANMGVSALATSFIKIMRYLDEKTDVSLLVGAQKPGHKLVDIGGNPYNVKIVNYRMSPKANLDENMLWILFLSVICRISPLKKIRNKIIDGNAWLKEVEDSRFVGSIHGGDSFSDIYGFQRYFYAVIPDFVAIFLNKPLVLLPQTYGPYKHTVSRIIARFLIKKACIVLCRDKNGSDGVQKIINNTKPSQKILFCPDVAFFLHTNPVSLPISISNDRKENNIPIVGINVNGLMYNGGYNKKNMFGINIDYGKLIENLIQKFLSESNANIILIPHNNAHRGDVESDMDACEKALQNVPMNLKNRVLIIDQKHSPSEIKGVISKCDFFIGSRMHACIAALSSGIPAIGLAYSKKFIGVFESIGADKLVVDARSVEVENAINLIWKYFEDRKSWSDSLKSRVPDIKKDIIEIFSSI